MAIITPMKIRSAVILVKIPYTGPSCIPFIHCLAFYYFSYKRCIFGVSEGHDYHAHNAISVFLVCIPCSSATFGSKEILPVSLKINALLDRPNISRRKVFVLSDRLCRFSIVTTSENSLFHDRILSKIHPIQHSQSHQKPVYACLSRLPHVCNWYATHLC